jgi:hypothetical protein
MYDWGFANTIGTSPMEPALIMQRTQNKYHTRKEKRKLNRKRNTKMNKNMAEDPPIPIKAFDCIVFNKIPCAREMLSIISKPT